MPELQILSHAVTGTVPDLHHTMTTVVVTKKGGIACIAADTLATYGDMRESADLIANSDKLVRIGDAWVAPTGPASAQLVLKHLFLLLL